MPPDRRPPRGGRLVPSVLGALWCKPHLTVPQRVPLQCARPWGGEAGPSRQWRGVSPPNGTGRCWSHGPGERCRRVNTCPATPPRQETLASSRPFDAIGPAPAPGWALPGDAAIALYGARHPQRHRFLQRCNAPARGAGRAPVHAGRMARCRLRPEDVSPVDALTAPSRTRALESAWCPCGPAPFRGVGSSRQRRGVSPPNGAARALSPSTIHAGESKSSRRTSCLGRVAIPESEALFDQAVELSRIDRSRSRLLFHGGPCTRFSGLAAISAVLLRSIAGRRLCLDGDLASHATGAGHILCFRLLALTPDPLARTNTSKRLKRIPCFSCDAGNRAACSSFHAFADRRVRHELHSPSCWLL
jgi:hypothetical protein